MRASPFRPDFLVENYVEPYTAYSRISQLTANHIFIKNLHIHQKHYDKECGVFGMVKIKFLEVKL